ncbi:RidA family protein [Glutamicibacter endophyticus]|uniref:RidA family protein n=1 Tax=Glutamicibacter endophyticus TaxID=1522174 RepID=UPI003AEF28A2
MAVHRFSPANMLEPAPYDHVAVATGTRHIHVAGQVAYRPDGAQTPDNLRDQAAQALRNTATGLASVGATFDDVVRLTIYVTDWQTGKINELMEGIYSVAQEVGLPTPMPPSSLIGVEMLFDAQTLIEIEATAILD